MGIKVNEACKPACSINKREGFNGGKLRGDGGQEKVEIWNWYKFVMITLMESQLQGLFAVWYGDSL